MIRAGSTSRSAQPADGRFPSSYDPEKLWSFEGGIKLDLFDRRAVIDLSGFYQKYADIQATVNMLIGNISTRQCRVPRPRTRQGSRGSSCCGR